MLKNKTINLGIFKKVAKALGELNDQVVYVRGAMVSLYADDPAADYIIRKFNYGLKAFVYYSDFS